MNRARKDREECESRKERNFFEHLDRQDTARKRATKPLAWRPSRFLEFGRRRGRVLSPTLVACRSRQKKKLVVHLLLWLSEFC